MLHIATVILKVQGEREEKEAKEGRMKSDTVMKGR